MNQSAPNRLLTLLHAHQGLDHLNIRKRGKSLTLCSGPDDNIQQHARLINRGPDFWQLSFPNHTGRWEPTPFIGSMDDLVDTLVNDFGFHLEHY